MERQEGNETTNGSEVIRLVDGDEEVLNLKVLEPEVAGLRRVTEGEAITRGVGVVLNVRALC